MGFSIKVISHIDVPLHLRRIRSEKLWTFAANEWFRLITSFVPMDSGVLSTTTDMELPKGKAGKKKRIRGKEIQSIAENSGNIKGENGEGSIVYAAPYAARMYYNNYNFRKDKHPKASSEWDKAAAPTQKKKLIAAMQKYVESGRLEL